MVGSEVRNHHLDAWLIDSYLLEVHYSAVILEFSRPIDLESKENAILGVWARTRRTLKIFKVKSSKYKMILVTMWA